LIVALSTRAPVPPPQQLVRRVDKALQDQDAMRGESESAQALSRASPYLLSKPDQIAAWIELCKWPLVDLEPIVKAIRKVDPSGPKEALGDHALLSWAAAKYKVDVRTPWKP
jgi:hypothetical protein